jgi:hypothetical protein
LDEYLPGDRQQAEEARLSIELKLLRAKVEREVVLLEAATQKDLRKTHRRYFEGLDQLLKPAPAHAQ